MGRENYLEKLKIAARQHTKERDFWFNQLAGNPIKSHFPYDHDGTGKNEYNSHSLTFELAEDLSAKLMELSSGSDHGLNLVLVTAVVILLNKYSTANPNDILIGTPIYKQEIKGDFINTVLVLRNPVKSDKTFKEFILQVRETIADAVENQNYPFELLVEQLNPGSAAREDANPLFDTAVLFENIHQEKSLHPIRHNMAFAFRRDSDRITGSVEYNSLLYEKPRIEKMVGHLFNLLRTALFNVHLRLSEIDILSEEEKKKLLYDFNDTASAYPKEKTVHQWFEEQAERTPGQLAVCSPINLNDIYDWLQSGTPGPGPAGKIETCCFKENPYVFRTPLEMQAKKGHLHILKSHRHNSVIVNRNTVELIRLFDGKRNLISLYTGLRELEKSKGMPLKFLIFSMSQVDLLEVSFRFHNKAEVFSTGSRFDDFIKLVKTLYREHVIRLTGTNAAEPVKENTFGEHFQNDEFLDDGISLETLFPKYQDREISTARVLLLGDTPGMPTTGLLYLASYLRRKGIKSYCQFYDPSWDYTSMRENVEALLQKVQPVVCAVSMKWFLYIARVFDMCRIVKEYAKINALDIKVVVGGNTASYYRDEIIKDECIDYLVTGDGEEPFLRICRGDDITGIPNCLYKKNGEIIENPVNYVQEETNASDIYLSHLDELLLSEHASIFGTFYIYTHKGCAKNCLYCGGCNRAQQKTFNRKGVLRRGIEEVRKDILAARGFASTFQFQFDFDIPGDQLLDYCKAAWKNIDLSGHFCIFSTLTLPSPALIECVSRTFKYVHWDLDISTLSERHRKQLFSQGLLKPQPTDEEILDFMMQCDKWSNIEVRLNLINGLPYFTVEDIAPAETFLSRVMNTCSCLAELHWARLHAQPGAPILESASKYRMFSFASSFADFLKYSRENFNRDSGYLKLEDLNYPYIYFDDDQLNSRVTKFYLESNRKIRQYNNSKQRDLLVFDTLTYGELNEKAGQLGNLLRARGITPGNIVALLLERSIHIPAAILAVLKAGGAYLPIDPAYPEERINYMLADSNAAIVLSAKDIETSRDNRSYRAYLPVKPGNVAYIIYTSGTTGKPKGVLLTHENLVNYVHWFTTAANLTGKDKTVLTSSFAFDLGYTSLYSSLLTGGALHILPEEIYLSADRLLDYIKQAEITYIKMTPSLFSIIVNNTGFSVEKCKSLRLAVLGGEPINVKDIERARSICSCLRIMNHYGPTEATIGCIAQFIPFDRFGLYKENPTIGKPIDNTHAYILGKDLNLLPVGVPGELFISGTGLARGYLNRPELTNSKFQENSPLSFSASQLLSFSLYRTGDLAKWLPDGTIEFLGRIDNQVKIRGYRIELGEIENRLLQHRSVEEAFVMVKEAAQKYICAYIVPRQEKDAGPEKNNKEIVRLMGIEQARNTGQTVSIVSRFREQAAKNFDKTAVESNGKSLTYGSLDRYAGRVARIILEKYDDRYKLSKSERRRYKRQMLLHGWGMGSQEKLKQTTVFVAGAGGGASPTITQLALAGFGTIIICDCDEVELSNLNRQFLHDESRIGMNKALSAKKTVNRLNPNVKVIARSERLTRENVCDLVGNASVIFDMFDGPESKFVLSEYAAVKQVPHIISAMTELSSYTAIFHSPYTPCYHCLFDREKFDALNKIRGVVENYEKNPLHVVASSLFTSTGFAVTEAIKIVLGFDNPAYNKFFFFNQKASAHISRTDGYKMMTYPFSRHFRKISLEQGFDWDAGWRGNFLEELKIEPDPDCPLCGIKGKETRKALEEKMKQAHIPVYSEEENPHPPAENRQTIALFLDQNIDMAAGIMGTLKAGKTCLPLDPAADMERLADVLEDSEARIILTTDEYMGAAEKLRDKVNRNIKIVNMNRLDEFFDGRKDLSRHDLDIEIEPAPAACLLYPPDPGGNPGFNAAVTDFYRGFLKEFEPYVFTNNKKADNPGSLPGQLREYLLEVLPGYMIPTHFVQLDKMPLTPNGKIDRKALPEPGTGPAEEDYAAPTNPIEEKLVEIWSGVLGVENIGIENDFFQFGLDSIKALQGSARMRKHGLKADMGDIFANPNIKQLSKNIERIDRVTDREIVAGEVALTPIQKWFFENDFAESHHFNMAVLLYREEGFDEEFISSAFEKIMEHHDALRMVYRFPKDKIIQENRSPGEKMVDLDIINLQKEENIREIIGREADRVQSEIDLETGPLMKLALFKTSEGDHLLIVIHHLVVDGISWRILFEDMELLFQQYTKGAPFLLPPKSDSFKSWSERCSEYANSELFLQEKTFWAELVASAADIPRIPADFEGENHMEDINSLSFSLSEEQTLQLLTETNRAFGTEINDILLTALGLAVRKLFGLRYLFTAMEGHGREQIFEDIDISRTIGWFTSSYPVLLDISYENDLARQIKEIKETLHRLPHKGIGYGILKYLTAEEHKKELCLQLNPQVSFNYLGQFDADAAHMSSFRISNMPTGNSRSLKGKRTYDLDISGMTAGKRLTMSISFSKKQYKAETVKNLMEHYKTELGSIISFCSAREEKEVTPSDFTYKELSIDQLDRLFD